MSVYLGSRFSCKHIVLDMTAYWAEISFLLTFSIALMRVFSSLERLKSKSPNLMVENVLGSTTFQLTWVIIKYNHGKCGYAFINRNMETSGKVGEVTRIKSLRRQVRRLRSVGWWDMWWRSVGWWRQRGSSYLYIHTGAHGMNIQSFFYLETFLVDAAINCIKICWWYKAVWNSK